MRKYFPLLLLPFLLFSCKKASDIGSNLLSDDDLFLAYTDTVTIRTQTVFDSTLRSDRTTYSYLGHVEEPIFGSSEGSVLTQFTLLAPFRDSVGPNTLDSIILYLQYDNFFGDSTVPQSFEVYRLTETPNTSTTYRSDYQFTTGALVGSVSGITFSSTSKYYFNAEDTVGAVGIIRIPLTTAFGNDLLAQAGTEFLRNDSSFKKYLPGFIIKPVGSSGKGMAQIDLRSVFTKFTLYFRNKDNDTLILDYPTALSSFWHDKYVHNYGGSVVSGAINTGAPAGDAVNYIQGQGGTKTKIEFPFLSALGQIAVNKAELEVYQLYDGSVAGIRAPLFLYAHTRDTDGKFANISDYNLIGTFGGAYFGRADTITDNMGRKVIRYTINISDYLQDVVSGRKANDPLYLSEHPIRSNSATTIAGDYRPYRILIGGSDRTDEYKIRLKLKYSLPE